MNGTKQKRRQAASLTAYHHALPCVCVIAMESKKDNNVIRVKNEDLFYE